MATQSEQAFFAARTALAPTPKLTDEPVPLSLFIPDSEQLEVNTSASCENFLMYLCKPKTIVGLLFFLFLRVLANEVSANQNENSSQYIP